MRRQVSCIAGDTTDMARNAISERVVGMPRAFTHDMGPAFRDIPENRPST